MLLPDPKAHQRILSEILSSKKKQKSHGMRGAEVSSMNRDKVLSAMQGNPKGLTYAELKQLTGLSKPSLSTHLQHIGAFSITDPKDGRYIWFLGQ